jgi:hypothetical protein
LKYQFGATSSDALSASTQNAVTAAFNSGSDFNQVQWNLSISDSETSQGNTPNAGQVVNTVTNPTTNAPLSQQTAQAGVNYALNRSVTLLSGFGYERIKDNTLDGNTKGPFGSFGIGLTGSRLTLNLNYNLRYNSQFVSLDGSWDITDRLRLTGKYGESIQTQQSLLIQQAGSIGLGTTGGFINPATGLPFNPLVNPGGVNSGIGNAAFLDKSGQFALTGNYDRNTWAITVSQESQSSAQSNFNQTTLSLAGQFAHQMSEALRLNVNGGYLGLNETSPTSITNNTYNLTAGVSYDLGRGVTTSATYSFLYRNSNTAGQDIRESSLTLSLGKTF